MQKPAILEKKMALLRFRETLVTWRGFKQASSHRLQAKTVSEFENSCSELAEQGYRHFVKLHVPRSPKETSVYFKTSGP